MEKKSNAFLIGLFMMLTGFQLLFIAMNVGCSIFPAVLMIIIPIIMLLGPAIKWAFNDDTKKENR